jgi:hypothetical protein
VILAERRASRLAKRDMLSSVFVLKMAIMSV